MDRRRDGYPPIEDHGLIGDGRGSALVGRDGQVGFLSVPRFDDPPLFCPLLDRHRGGGLLLAPDGLRASSQRYLTDTGVLVTEMTTDEATVELTDAFVLQPGARLERSERAAAGELVRGVRVSHGTAALRVAVRTRDGTGIRPDGQGGWLVHGPARTSPLRLRSSRPLRGGESLLRLDEGDELWLSLSWAEADAEADADGPARAPDVRHARDRLAATVAAWRRWAARLPYDLPRADLVRRSAITLKLLEHIENGAIVAAPTSSLPERVGGARNWDYRYTWLRDAAYAVFAQRRIGLPHEAERFLSWVLGVTRGGHGARVLYDVGGRPPPPERTDDALEGYRGSAPVRWGNAASDQIQHDIYGEILDCAFHWASGGGEIGEELWQSLAAMTRQAYDFWDRPDQSIWEIRSTGRTFTYSAAMCQVALDRAARLARRFGLPGDVRGWAREAGRISEHVLYDAWDEDAGAFTEHLGPGGGLDASLLALPLRRVIPADHPRMKATADAIARRLDAGGGLVYRYLPSENPDGLARSEGAFVLCGFWLVDNLAGQGRLDEATALFERLCGYASPLGLLSEEIDPSDGSLVGNFPQAFSHVGLISSAVTLARIQAGGGPDLATGAFD